MASSVSSKPMSAQDFMVVTFGYEMIYGFNGGGIARVIKEISEYKLESILESLSKIALRLYAYGPTNPKNQAELVRSIFAHDLALRQKIADTIKREAVPVWVIFSEQPILTLYKIALQYAQKEDGKLIDEKAVPKVGHWLLLLTDECMGSEFESPLIIPRSHVSEQLREFMTRQFFFRAKERLPYRIARFVQLFRNIRKMHPEFDIDKKFAAATGGVNLNNYLSFCFFLLVKWVNIQNREVDLEKDWIVCKEKYFEQTRLTKKEIDQVLPLLLLSLLEYDAKYKETVDGLLQGTDIFPFNFLLLRQRPLIPYQDHGCFVCPSPDFLMDKATEGTYWIVENDLKDKKQKKERDLLPSVWGDAFEAYIHDRMKSAFGRKYHKRIMDGTNEVFDGILDDTDYFFPIEIKYAHWSYKAKMTGKKEDMLPTLQQLFSSNKKTKGLGQLTKGVKAVEQGKVDLPLNKTGKKIVPILIVGEPMPIDAFSRRLYEDTARIANAYYESADVMPFIILDAEEVEILEAIALEKGSDEAKRLLIQYAQIFQRRNEYGMVPEAVQFKNFLYGIGYEAPNNKKLFKLFDASVKTAVKKGFTKKEIEDRNTTQESKK